MAQSSTQIMHIHITDPELFLELLHKSHMYNSKTRHPLSFCLLKGDFLGGETTVLNFTALLSA